MTNIPAKLDWLVAERETLREKISRLVNEFTEQERTVQKAALAVLHVDLVHQKTVMEIVDVLVRRIQALEMP